MARKSWLANLAIIAVMFAIVIFASQEGCISMLAERIVTSQ